MHHAEWQKNGSMSDNMLGKEIMGPLIYHNSDPFSFDFCPFYTNIVVDNGEKKYIL